MSRILFAVGSYLEVMWWALGQWKGRKKNTLNDIIILRTKFVLTKLVDILNLSPYRGLTLKTVSWLLFYDSNFLSTCPMFACLFHFPLMQYQKLVFLCYACILAYCSAKMFARQMFWSPNCRNIYFTQYCNKQHKGKKVILKQDQNLKNNNREVPVYLFFIISKSYSFSCQSSIKLRNTWFVARYNELSLKVWLQY